MGASCLYIDESVWTWNHWSGSTRCSPGRPAVPLGWLPLPLVLLLPVVADTGGTPPLLEDAGTVLHGLLTTSQPQQNFWDCHVDSWDAWSSQQSMTTPRLEVELTHTPNHPPPTDPPNPEHQCLEETGRLRGSGHGEESPPAPLSQPCSADRIQRVPGRYKKPRSPPVSRTHFTRLSHGPGGQVDGRGSTHRRTGRGPLPHREHHQKRHLTWPGTNGVYGNIPPRAGGGARRKWCRLRDGGGSGGANRPGRQQQWLVQVSVYWCACGALDLYHRLLAGCYSIILPVFHSTSMQANGASQCFLCVCVPVSLFIDCSWHAMRTGSRAENHHVHVHLLAFWLRGSMLRLQGDILSAVYWESI